MKGIIKSSILMAAVMLLLCGLAYPLLVTGVSQAVFSNKANGSLVEYNGEIVGSKVVGQKFSDPKHFVGRVSAYNYNTYSEEDKVPDSEGKVAYGGVSSGSANLAPSNPALTERVEADMASFLELHPYLTKEDIPTDLLTSSGSGLDPHISVKSAEIQVKRVAEETGISEEKLGELIEKNTEGKTLGFLGEEKVNVLLLNLDVDSILKD